MRPSVFSVRRLSAVLLALAAAPWAWAAPAAATAIEVPVVQVRPQPVATGIEYDAVIQPVRQSTIAAQAAGRVVALLVKAGDRVKAGQVLATIDDRETQTGVQRSQAQVAQAEADLRNAKAQFDRTTELRQKGFVSQAALDSAEAQYKAALAGRDQAAAALRQAGLAQGYTRVTAPYEGWVLQTLADPGDLAAPGRPLLVLYAPRPLRAVVQVPASLDAVARSATRVEVQVPTAKGGAASWIEPTSRTALPAADPVAQTVEWRLDLPDAAASAVVPGQQVRVRFVGGSAERLVIPAQAVLRRGELTGVYTATEQGFMLKAVRLGADHGAAGIEVLAGLGRDDRVALDPVRAGLAGARPAAAAAAR
ncbi:MAG: efflux RND transporter periplasmic adaptor subunit [Tibeticola sp.]|jgi:RND family efflux transporter MFP subunit|nr:efflux RND transporter periplasmic adaptor subunit [Tibeticola sp.]